MEYYSHAQYIVARRREEYSIALAQTMTLAALYTNQIARLRESWADISLAYRIYMDYGNYAGVCNDVSAAQDRYGPMSEKTKRGSWICRELTRDINACLNIVSIGLVPISGSDMYPGVSPEKDPETVYRTRVLLRIYFDELCRLTPTGVATTNEAGLEYLTSRANKQIELLETWRSGLSSRLAWKDKEPPSTDPLLASLRSEYYNGIAQLLRPYLEMTQNRTCFNANVDKQSAGQRGFIEVILSWINGTLSSIIACDRIGAVPDSAYEAYQRASRSSVMLSNPVKTLHTECENVLILQAIRSSAIYPLLAGRTQLTEASLTALRLRTVDRLSGFWPNSPLLTQDLRMLRML
ncbi:hypothetical protein EJ07DRAFT_168352 [Lizonia empirigonia]|nr:hypothetical protein EJ07DRAFT_168352 [Lizonia empirigonia]